MRSTVHTPKHSTRRHDGGAAVTSDKLCEEFISDQRRLQLQELQLELGTDF